MNTTSQLIRVSGIFIVAVMGLSYSASVAHAQCVEGCEAIHTLAGEAAGDLYGWVSNAVEDLDGDGVREFITSAPFNGASNNGRVYVYNGATGALHFPAVSGFLPGEQLGMGVIGLGDVNADGTPDILAGGPMSGPGHAYVLSGVDGALVRTFTGETSGDQFGRKVGRVPDIDGDNVDDIVLGAPFHGTGGISAGRAYVYSGATGVLFCTVDGPSAIDTLGFSVTGVPDITGDGKGEFAAGAPGAGGGLAFVYSGGECLSTGTATPLFTLTPVGAATNFGMFFMDSGDMNFDGVADIYVGDFDASRAHVFSGVDGSSLRTFIGSGGFGIGRFVGDINTDGFEDLILASWVSPDGGNQAGKADIFSGRDGSILDTYTHNVALAQFGFDANGMGDVNGDNKVDYLVTAANDNGSTGKIFVLAGNIRRAAPASHLLVCGWQSGNVVSYAADNGDSAVGLVPAGSGGLGNAHSIRIGPDGRLYVTSVQSGGVLRYEADTGAFVDTFVTSAGNPLNTPTDAVFGPDGNLYVCSFNTGQVLRYNGATGSFIDVFASAPAPGQTEMAEWGADGHLYVSTGQANSVLRFDGTTGSPLPGPLGGGGTAEFVPPGSGILDSHHLTFGPDGNLYVSSMDNARILRFDGTTGASIDLFVSDNGGTPEDETGGLSSPHGIVFGPDGDLYAASFGSNNVLRYDGSTGSFKAVFATGGGLLQPTHLVFTVNPADFDTDFDVDQDDADVLVSCFSGTGIAVGVECEVADIDTDGDADCDDWSALKVRWTGPPVTPILFSTCDVDCNANDRADDFDLALGLALDCNTNNTPDACDIASGQSLDDDGDGVPDECCTSFAPIVPVVAIQTNRHIAFTVVQAEISQAIRVDIIDLPEPNDGAIGQFAWVGPPEIITENSGVRAPEDAPGSPTFLASRLQCDPFYADWNAMGPVFVYDERIIPEGVYELRAVDMLCPGNGVEGLSDPLVTEMSKWGDVVENCSTTPCGPPDGVVGVPTDVVSLLDKFSNLPGAVAKSRGDLEPALPDQRISITDISLSLDAFRGSSYPFLIGPNPCGS